MSDTADTSRDLGRLEGKVDILIGMFTEHRNDQDKRLTDHDKRIRSLELRQWFLFGGAMVGGAVIEHLPLLNKVLN